MGLFKGRSNPLLYLFIPGTLFSTNYSAAQNPSGTWEKELPAELLWSMDHGNLLRIHDFRMAKDGDNDVLLTWKAQYPGGTNGLYSAASFDNGQTWSFATRVGQTFSYSTNHCIAGDGTGRWCLVWGDFPPSRIQAVISTDGGKSWGAPAFAASAPSLFPMIPEDLVSPGPNRWVMAVNGEKGEFHRSSDGKNWLRVQQTDRKIIDLATDRQENVLALLRSNSGNYTVLRSEDNGASWDATANLPFPSPSSKDGGIAFNEDGSAIAVVPYSSNGNWKIAAARTVDRGRNWGSAITIAEDPSTDLDPIVVEGEGNDLMVMWLVKDGNLLRLKYALSEDGGQSWTSPALVTDRVSSADQFPGLPGNSAVSGGENNWLLATSLFDEHLLFRYRDTQPNYHAAITFPTPSDCVSLGSTIVKAELGFKSPRGILFAYHDGTKWLSMNTIDGFGTNPDLSASYIIEWNTQSLRRGRYNLKPFALFEMEGRQVYDLGGWETEITVVGSCEQNATIWQMY